MLPKFHIKKLFLYACNYFLRQLNPFEPRYVAVKCDHEGMNPKALKEALSQWKPEEIRDVKTGVPKVRLIRKNI